MLGNDSEIPAMLSGLAKSCGFFKASRVSHRSDLDMKNHLRSEASNERAECGGFNEAFIMQYWASYGPHH